MNVLIFNKKNNYIGEMRQEPDVVIPENPQPKRIDFEKLIIELKKIGIDVEARE